MRTGGIGGHHHARPLLYGSDYPYLSDAVLKDNLFKLKQTLVSDKELAGYVKLFLWRNAERLFVKDAVADKLADMHSLSAQYCTVDCPIPI